MKKYIYLLVFFFSLNCQAQSDDFEMIGSYKFFYPSWWNDVSICFPDSLTSQGKMNEYLLENFGSDVGDSTNWKEVMKHWYVYSKMNDKFPVYFGHCYRAVGDLQQAVKVFEDLYDVIPADSLTEWYQCYLPYCIGSLYAEQNRMKEAGTWYAKASDERFIKSTDEAITYYAQKCKVWLENNEE